MVRARRVRRRPRRRTGDEDRSAATATVQHKCPSCGAPAGPTGKCAQCGTPALAMAPTDDHVEGEADRMADRVAGAAALDTGASDPLRTSPEPAAAHPGARVTAPPSVRNALAAPGRPLDPATRKEMETGFGQKFNDVRIHTDATAARSARAIDALAYSAGRDIVFGAGQYDRRTPHGKWLLAHELGHVTQQRTTGPWVARKGDTARGFFANIGRGVAAALTGSEPEYDDETLDDYLATLLDADAIEGDFDSDNKARAVVWKGLHKGWPPSLWALLIQEMLAGATLDADEQAILELLETATPDDREEIAETVGYSELHNNIHGEERDRLYALFPVLNSLHPRGQKESVTYTFEEYIDKWEKEQGRKMTADEKETLARGCVGVTALNMGQLENPKLTSCYASFADALKSQTDMNDFLEANYPNRRAIIFSKRFWSGGEDYEPDPATGEVDMSGYDYSARPGDDFTNFDYGFYDEKSGKWWHANHCDETTLGIECTGDTTDLGEMEVYESNLQYYSQRLGDFDKQVFCIGISRLAGP